MKVEPLKDGYRLIPETAFEKQSLRLNGGKFFTSIANSLGGSDIRIEHRAILKPKQEEI